MNQIPSVHMPNHRTHSRTDGTPVNANDYHCGLLL